MRQARLHVKPPSGACLMSGHPLAYGLTLAVECVETGGSNLWDFVTGRPMVNLAATTRVIDTRAPSPYGGLSIGITAATSSNTAAMISPAPSVASGTPCTIEVVLRWRSSDNYGCVATNSGGNAGLFVRSTGVPQLYPGSASSVALTANAWTHLVVTRSSANIPRYYINGRFVNEGAVAAAATITIQNLLNNSASETCYADMDRVRFWSGRVLSDSEIQQLYVAPFSLYQYGQRRRGDVFAGGAPTAFPFHYYQQMSR